MRVKWAVLGAGVEERQTKTRSRRTVTLPRFVAEMISEQVADYPSDGHIFSSAKGGPVRHYNFMKRHFYPAVRRLAGLSGRSKRRPSWS